jgi:very-short-patch-repair endonuclease
LERKSIRSGFRLKLHDDEPRFNQTLLEMLRQDFNLTIDGLSGELPRDDSGIDLDLIWCRVENAIKDISGWEVVREAVLSTFSFAKYLMWKDLVDRTDLLKRSPVVRHLIDTPRDKFPADREFIRREQLDYIRQPTETYCPLPADSSQLAAVMSAAIGKDFVLIGPPGTGKSQTIANAISQCLAEGKKVLFVSAKTAALDVVHRRLAQMGLGDFCLELHSAKASKGAVLAQLARSLAAKGAFDSAQWEREGGRLKDLRDKLNVFVGRIHKTHANGLNLFKAIGTGIKAPADVFFSWSNPGQHDRDALDKLRDIAGSLDVNGAAIGGVKENPLSWIQTSSWSPAWQGEVEATARNLAKAALALPDAARHFCDSTGIEAPRLLGRVRQGLGLLAEVLPHAAGRDWRFALRPDANQLVQKLQKASALLEELRAAKEKLSIEYRDDVLELDHGGLMQAWEMASDKWWLAKLMGQSKIKKELLACATTPRAGKTVDCLGDLIQLKVMRVKDGELEVFADLGSKTNGIWTGLKTDLEEVQSAVAFQSQLSRAIGMLADSADTLSIVMTAISRLLGEANALLAVGGTVFAAASVWVEADKVFNEAYFRFSKLAETAERAGLLDRLLPDEIAEKANAVAANAHRLNAWCAWRRAHVAANAEGIGNLAEAISSASIAIGGAKRAFEAAYCRWWVDAVIETDDVLKGFSSADHERSIEDFKTLDRQFADLTRDCVRARICAGIPDATNVSKSSELGTLNREIAKKKRHIPLRQLISNMPTQLTRLAPCLMMSPISIAQYLPADLELFDVVIFDEASQIPVWDAVGAIARAKQAIIVGDPKQMPPTNFFSRADTGGEDDDVAHEEDLESILDECLGCNLPRLDLTWHYRSRHESLIAFSNAQYYKNLVTFPSPVTEDRAVSFTHVDGAFYEKGETRTNQGEAKAIVADIVKNLRDQAFADSGFSIGVVTFNSEQQRLIEDLLDAERRKFPEIEPHFAEDRLEQVFVKNLESVQGDERDVMYFSITYGPDRNGKISMNFGPMNQEGGPRRLNVAVTRARHALKVFSTLLPEQIDISRTKAEGVKDLKLFLDFAKRGAKAFAAQARLTGGDYDSAFEKAVAEALRAKGWAVHPQVGVSGFRIDLGIVDPDSPGAYLAGVECDGAAYHSSATARDRDRLREEVLRSLGWNIVRIWSTDWWIDRVGAADKAHARLTKILEDRLIKEPEPESGAPIEEDAAKTDAEVLPASV